MHPTKSSPKRRSGPPKGTGGRPRLSDSLARYAWALEQAGIPQVRIAEQLLGIPDQDYMDGVVKDPERAAAGAKVRRLIDRGAESVVRDLGLKLRIFRQRVPWVREPGGGRGPKRHVRSGSNFGDRLR